MPFLKIKNNRPDRWCANRFSIKASYPATPTTLLMDDGSVVGRNGDIFHTVFGKIRHRHRVIGVSQPGKIILQKPNGVAIITPGEYGVNEEVVPISFTPDFAASGIHDDVQILLYAIKNRCIYQHSDRYIEFCLEEGDIPLCFNNHILGTYRGRLLNLRHNHPPCEFANLKKPIQWIVFNSSGGWAAATQSEILFCNGAFLELSTVLYLTVIDGRIVWSDGNGIWCMIGDTPEKIDQNEDVCLICDDGQGGLAIGTLQGWFMAFGKKIQLSGPLTSCHIICSESGRILLLKTLFRFYEIE